jgi:hypothetical protein
MNETPDPLETELRAFHPPEISAELRQRIAWQLARSSARRKPQRRAIVLSGGLAAACLAGLILWWERGHGTSGPPVIAGPRNTPAIHPDDALPSLRVYRQALARSPEDLDALLDKHAARGFGPNPQLVRIRAFTRPDPEGKPTSGEL